MNLTDLAPFYSFWREWFAQPEAEKLKHLRSPGKGGYYPMGSEAPGYEQKADPKEYFHYRWHHEIDQATEDLFTDCILRADSWCHDHGLSKLTEAVKFEDCVLRILHYPATADGNVGQAHCDFDLLTVSVPGTVPGLEVWELKQYSTDPNESVRGYWALRESFEVHVGEMLTHYTRGRVPATPHRVRTPPNTERFKAVFFYLPPNDFELRPGYTAGDYLKAVLTKAGTIGIGAK